MNGRDYLVRVDFPFSRVCSRTFYENYTSSTKTTSANRDRERERGRRESASRRPRDKSCYSEPIEPCSRATNALPTPCREFRYVSPVKLRGEDDPHGLCKPYFEEDNSNALMVRLFSSL